MLNQKRRGFILLMNCILLGGLVGQYINYKNIFGVGNIEFCPGL
jgi:hypothetical protein